MDATRGPGQTQQDPLADLFPFFRQRLATSLRCGDSAWERFVSSESRCATAPLAEAVPRMREAVRGGPGVPAWLLGGQVASRPHRNSAACRAPLLGSKRHWATHRATRRCSSPAAALALDDLALTTTPGALVLLSSCWMLMSQVGAAGLPRAARCDTGAVLHRWQGLDSGAMR